MKIQIKGNIGADAILRTVGEGENLHNVCDFNVAENRKLKDGTTKTTWTKVTLWNNYAVTMAPFLKSGRKVLVEGDGDVETYVTGGTQIMARLHINRNVDIDLLDSPAKEDAPWSQTEAELEEV